MYIAFTFETTQQHGICCQNIAKMRFRK